MTIWKNAFGSLQKIGKALMLPVSVLPVAGILLGVGSAHFTWLPAIVSDVMAQSGGAIFGNLPLIFAIGVALGLVLALATNRIITTMLFAITPMDTQAYAGVLVVALPLVTLAALVPALRAARVDPMTALREP